MRLEGKTAIITGAGSGQGRAAALAADRITGGEVDRLRGLLTAEADEPRRFQRRALDVEFHQAIADASRNDLMSNAVREIRVQLALGLDLIPWSVPRRDESHREHVALVKALATANASAARVAMQRHVVATEKVIRASLVELGVRAELDVTEDEGVG